MKNQLPEKLPDVRAFDTRPLRIVSCHDCGAPLMVVPAAYNQSFVIRCGECGKVDTYNISVVKMGFVR